MRIPHKPRTVRLFPVFVLGWALLFWTGIALGGPSIELSPRSGTVAIDPGHGGRHHGASGPTGLLEKAVALELARLLALDLEPDYRVVLTRSDDYHVDLRQRTAIANNAKADMLISLHTGAGFRHATHGRAIYYHIVQGGDDKALLRGSGSMAQRPWHQVQTKHTQASQALAKIFKAEINAMSATAPCHIQGAPLVVLQGADMPAALIEVGHITHPETEKKLATPEAMAQLVKAIHQGIDEFFRQRGN